MRLIALVEHLLRRVKILFLRCRYDLRLRDLVAENLTFMPCDLQLPLRFKQVIAAVSVAGKAIGDTLRLREQILGPRVPIRVALARLCVCRRPSVGVLQGHPIDRAWNHSNRAHRGLLGSSCYQACPLAHL